MKENGIYGIHIEGIYCEVKVHNEKIIDGFIDYLFPIYVLNAISASYITNSKEPISIYSQIQSFLDDIHYIV